MFEMIQFEIVDHVATITLNRPDKLNAFGPDMAMEIIAAFDECDANDDVRAVIVTGAGRGFCAGKDLSAGTATFDYAASGRDAPVQPDGSIDWSHEAVRDFGGKVALRIYDSLKPVIGAINGAAVGIGITMTLPMDIRLAVHGVRIGFIFAPRGIVPEAASGWFLPRIVGISRAVEWCVTGRMLSAEEAFEAGLFRSLHAPGDLLPAARAIAAEIVACAPVSVVLARKMMWQGLSMGVPMEAHRIDSRGVYARGRSSDVKEGIASFLEKRPAHFTDHVSTGMPEWFPWWEEAHWR